MEGSSGQCFSAPGLLRRLLEAGRADGVGGEGVLRGVQTLAHRTAHEKGSFHRRSPAILTLSPGGSSTYHDAGAEDNGRYGYTALGRALRRRLAGKTRRSGRVVVARRRSWVFRHFAQIP